MGPSHRVLHRPRPAAELLFSRHHRLFRAWLINGYINRVSGLRRDVEAITGGHRTRRAASDLQPVEAAPVGAVSSAGCCVAIRPWRCWECHGCSVNNRARLSRRHRAVRRGLRRVGLHAAVAGRQLFLARLSHRAVIVVIAAPEYLKEVNFQRLKQGLVDPAARSHDVGVRVSRTAHRAADTLRAARSHGLAGTVRSGRYWRGSGTPCCETPHPGARRAVAQRRQAMRSC